MERARISKIALGARRVALLQKAGGVGVAILGGGPAKVVDAHDAPELLASEGIAARDGRLSFTLKDDYLRWSDLGSGREDALPIPEGASSYG